MPVTPSPTIEFIHQVAPSIGEAEVERVSAYLRSGAWLTEFEQTERFERMIAEWLGVKHCSVTTSGTVTLTLALMALGVGAGDEVIVPPFTFIATANAALFVGAKPVFADVEPGTFNIDPAEIERKITKRTRAIIPVDLYGHPAKMDEIMAIAEKHGLSVIEDACQAHGATINGRKCGSFDIGCFSFYPTKNMTTSEGGMLTTDDSTVAEMARMIRSHGSKVRYYHEMLGFNLRMTDISAAIGLAQLKHIDHYDDLRIANAIRLNEKLRGIRGIVTPTIASGCRHVFHQYTIRVTPDFGMSRDGLIKKLTEAGIGTGIYYPVPIHKQTYYRSLGYDDHLPVSEQLAQEVVSLPVHPAVTPEDIDLNAETIRRL
jgi:dTDP-4-amino-4,6-dideoxygalactose transaminase